MLENAIYYADLISYNIFSKKSEEYMDFLEFLQGLRNPVCDFFFSVITLLGEETVFIVIGLLFFWCINKKQGYFLLSLGLLGTVLNQFLKLVFRIPRPWILKPDFPIVESAREAATGYSFPSGHTQAGVGIFGGVARWNKQRWLRIGCIALCVLIPFSRMWLGVHTPLDVGVSIIIALILIFGIYPIIQKDNKNHIRILFAVMVLIDIALILYAQLYNFPKNVDVDNLIHGTESAYKMLGCISGMWLAYEVDKEFSHFSTNAKWWAQIIKFAIGVVPVILIKSLLKQPLYDLVGNLYVADGIRYFLLTAFAGAIWPFTFKFWRSL